MCLYFFFERETEQLCLHKSLLGAKFTGADTLSFVIFFVAAGISAGGGVGGGGIFNTIFYYNL